jgi:hypothetical protein
MTKSVQYIAIGLVATSSIACAEDLSTARTPLLPGTFTTSAHSDEWKIENALSAGPASITDHATVVDWRCRSGSGWNLRWRNLRVVSTERIGVSAPMEITP